MQAVEKGSTYFQTAGIASLESGEGAITATLGDLLRETGSAGLERVHITGRARGVSGAGTKPVTDGKPADSDGLVFDTAGTFYWQAVYSGDANNKGARSACTEEKLSVAPLSMVMVEPKLTPTPALVVSIVPPPVMTTGKEVFRLAMLVAALLL